MKKFLFYIYITLLRLKWVLFNTIVRLVLTIGIFYGNSSVAYAEDDSSDNENSEDKEDNAKKKAAEKLIEQEIKYFDNRSAKPTFENPGYPDFNKISKYTVDHAEYDYYVQKFEEKHSAQNRFKEYDKTQTEAVVKGMKEKHPEVNEKFVREHLEKLQSKNYSEDSCGANEETGINKKEAEWLDKMQEKAWEHGGNLAPDNPDGRENNARSRREMEDDSGLEDENEPQTPSTAFSPTPEPEETENLNESTAANNKRSNSESRDLEDESSKRIKSLNNSDPRDKGGSGGSSGGEPSGGEPSGTGLAKVQSQGPEESFNKTQDFSFFDLEGYGYTFKSIFVEIYDFIYNSLFIFINITIRIMEYIFILMF